MSFPVVLHAADLHIGKQYGPSRIDPVTGLRLTTVRELETLEEIADIAIWGPDPELRAARKAAEPETGPIPPCADRVGIVVFAGDLFDYPAPIANRIMSAVFRQLLRLHRAGIKVVLIAGNHCSPKLRAEGSPYAILDRFDEPLGIHVVFRGVYERVPKSGAFSGVVVHAVPHTYSLEQMREELARAAEAMLAERAAEAERGDRHYHILLSHVGVNTTSIPIYRYGSGESLRVEIADLDRGYDLVLLGDYHGEWDYEGRIFYAPCCRNRFDEAHVTPHVNRCVLTPDGPRVERIPLRTVRPMIDLEPIRCVNPQTGEVLPVEEINRLLHERTQDAAQWGDHMVRLVIQDAPRGLADALDHRRVSWVMGNTFWFKLEIRYQSRDDESIEIGRDEAETIQQRLLAKLRRFLPERLLPLGIQYLSRAFPELRSAEAHAAAAPEGAGAWTQEEAPAEAPTEAQAAPGVGSSPEAEPAAAPDAPAEPAGSDAPAAPAASAEPSPGDAPSAESAAGGAQEAAQVRRSGSRRRRRAAEPAVS